MRAVYIFLITIFGISALMGMFNSTVYERKPVHRLIDLSVGVISVVMIIKIGGLL